MARSLQWAAIVFLVTNTACAGRVSAPTPAAIASPSPRPTSSPSQKPTTPSATTPTVVPPIEPNCLDGKGRIVYSELIDSQLPRSLPFRVFIPPCAEESIGQLPTLYLLHGLAFTDAQWDELGADEIAGELISTQQAPPFLIVMPWERKGLDYPETIVDYLVPTVEERYGASADRDRRAIGGISRGAGWALRIGLQHAEKFGAIGLHSPAVLVPDLFDIPGWVESGLIPAIWIDIGDRDTLRFAAADLMELLDELTVSYSFASYPGEHTNGYWGAHIDDYLRWYVANWGP